MAKVMMPKTSMYCKVCDNNSTCDKSKTCACENYKSKIPFRTKK